MKIRVVNRWKEPQLYFAYERVLVLGIQKLMGDDSDAAKFDFAFLGISLVVEIGEMWGWEREAVCYCFGLAWTTVEKRLRIVLEPIFW